MPAFITFGRVLFAVLFIYTGATKLFALQATADAIAVGVFEIIAGLMVAVNFAVRLFAILLIFYLIAVTFYFNDFWNQAPPDNGKTLVEALKNLSIIGGLFIIAGYGRGPRLAEPAYGDV